MLLAILGISALVTSGLLLTTSNSSKEFSTIIGALGLLGFTAAGAYARAKSLAVGLIEKLSNLYQIGLVSSAATIRPKPPVLSQPRARTIEALSSTFASGINSQVTRESL